MNTVKFFMAHPIAHNVNEPIPVKIVIDELVPDRDHTTTLDEMHRFYEEQADALVDALYHALPQGTFDRVALKMFEKKLSLYCGVTQS